MRYLNTRLILVAGGNGDKRGELRAALELEGHAVAEAATAPDTIRKACAEPHDLLVLESVVGSGERERDRVGIFPGGFFQARDRGN